MGEDKGGMFQENSIETCILSSVKQITSPGWMHETSARTWCTGKTQRDRVEREVGGVIGMGNTCKPIADSFQCMTKPTTIFKKEKKFALEAHATVDVGLCIDAGRSSPTHAQLPHHLLSPSMNINLNVCVCVCV